MSDHLSKLTIEKLVTGENIADSDAAKTHLTTCHACKEYFELLKDYQKKFNENHPFESVKKTNHRISPLFFRIAAIIVFAVGISIYFANNKDVNYSNIKGSTELELYKLNADGTSQKVDSAIFTPGTRIQFTYSCSADSFFILIGIDTAGRITHYYPDTDSFSIALSPGRGIPLNNSILLDNYIGKELFVAWFSTTPIRVSSVVKKLGKNAVLSDIEIPTPENSTARKVLIQKRMPHL